MRFWRIEARRVETRLGARRRRGPQDGSLPLYLAAMNGHAAAARVLLEQGADANVQKKVWVVVAVAPMRAADLRSAVCQAFWFAA